jgi:hypothetical protein
MLPPDVKQRAEGHLQKLPKGRLRVEHRSDGFTAVEDRYAGHTVYDQDGEKIGKVDDLFVDEHDQPEYI